MKKEPRNSLFGGYPHHGIQSKEVFPNRVSPALIDGKVAIFIHPSKYPAVPYHDTDEYKDFLIDRIADYHQALEICEKQIEDMRHPYPFIPEDFGFERSDIVIDGDPNVYNSPLYQKGASMIGRKDEDLWIYHSKTGSGDIRLPNAHIAFLVLRSLGLIDDSEFEGDAEFMASENELTEEEKKQLELMNQVENK